MFYNWAEGFYKSLASCLLNFRYCISSDLANSLKIVIVNNDLSGLDYIIRTKVSTDESNKILERFSDELLSYCYFRSNFLFAEKLIYAGAIFRSDYIINYFSLAVSNTSSAIKHIKVIKPHIAEIEFSKANKIVAAMNSPINTAKYNQSCIDHVQIWLSVTYTDNQKYYTKFNKIYEDFSNNSQLIMNNLFHIFSFANYPEAEIKILAPIINDTSAAFHNFKLSLIYAPFLDFSSLEKAILIHEVGHYIIYNSFENKGYPFSKNNPKQEQDYDIAATKSLCNIGELIGFKCDNKATKGLKSHQAAFELLQHGIITIFYYRTLFNDKETSIELKNKIFKIIKTKFNIYPDFIEKHDNKETLNILVEGVIREFNLTKDSIILLERIGEYVGRADIDDYSSELIVRLPELIARDLDNNTLSYLDPLQTYWLNNIHLPDSSTQVCGNKNILEENTTLAEVVGDSIREEL